MRWSPSPWFWFGVAHVHSPQYLPSSSLALSKCSGFTSQPPERSNSTFCFNNNCLKTTCGKFGSSPAVLKGEEKGVLLALHMSGPLQPPGPISSPTSGCSCSRLGQHSHLPRRDTRREGLFLVSHMPVFNLILVRQNCCTHPFSWKVL